MECLIDINKKEISLHGEFDAKRLILHFVAGGEPGEKLSFKNVRFGYQIQKNGQEIVEESWPIKGVTFDKLGPGPITTADITLSTDTEYRLLVWYTSGKERYTEIKTFNSGRPFKAYESMIWNKEFEDWQMVVPYPEDATEPQTWNEETLSWGPWVDPEFDKISNEQYNSIVKESESENG
jgi:hypothetical protein